MGKTGGGNRCAGVYGLIGLAARKGSVASGWEACERALKNGTDGFLLLAGDSAAGTKEHFKRFVSPSGDNYAIFGTAGELGKRTGNGKRSVIFITDNNIKRGICVLLGIADGNITGV